MLKFGRRVLYGRGLNFAAQINATRRNVVGFQEVEEMKGVPIKRLGCGYLQSYYLLDDGKFIKAGYFMDSLTSIRAINLHRLAPFVIPILQKCFFLGQTLSFRGGDQHPTHFNKQLESPFEDVIFGISRVFGITHSKQVYGMGQNYFGQLGTRNILNYETTFIKIEDINKEKILGVGCGFQHTLFVTDSFNVYGCGKASEYQIQSMRHAERKEIVDKIETPQVILKSERVRKVAGGLKFSLLWLEGNRLMAVGSNKFGQCGQNFIRCPQVKQLTEILFQWEKDEHILDIACGFCHSLILTNRYVYFFGSIQQGQNPFASFNENICTPTILPIKNPIKIFANFDRSAIIDGQGNAYIFGGLDYSYCGGQNGALETLEGFSQQSEIGLGFAHTLIYP